MWSRSHQLRTINIMWADREKQNGQKHDRTKAPKDKNQSGQNPQKRQYFSTPTIKVYNQISGHVITITPGVDIQHHVGAQRKAPMDKSTIGQKPQSIKVKADKTPQERQYFSTITIKVYNPISGHVITITTCVDNQHHVGAQRKAPMDKSTIGQKPQRIKIKADKTPKRGNILVRQQSRCTIPFLVTWSRSQQVRTINITWTHRENPQWTKAP